MTGANETLGLGEVEAGRLEAEEFSVPCVAISGPEALFIEEADSELEFPSRKKPGRRKLIIAKDLDLNRECLDADVVWVESVGVVGRLDIGR